MENFSFTGTKNLPTVLFDSKTGVLLLQGTSLPDNPDDFFAPIFDWLEEYSKSPKSLTQLDIKFNYFNTSTSKRVLQILQHLEGIYRKGFEVVVNWHYDEDDVDSMESGEDYASLVKVPVKLVCT